jgi:ATP-dependent protease ClpP protease subunit
MAEYSDLGADITDNGDSSSFIISEPEVRAQKATKYKLSIINEITHNILDYKKMLYILEQANETDSIELTINSGGGSCRTGYHLASAIKLCKAEVKIVVTYNCSSMAAILALTGDDLELSPGATLMFHNYTAGNAGKGAELIQSVQQQALQLNKLLEHYCAPFLSPEELEKINTDKDVYVHAWDRNLNARIKRHFE